MNLPIWALANALAAGAWAKSVRDNRKVRARDRNSAHFHLDSQFVLVPAGLINRVDMTKLHPEFVTSNFVGLAPLVELHTYAAKRGMARNFFASPSMISPHGDIPPDVADCQVDLGKRLNPPGTHFVGGTLGYLKTRARALTVGLPVGQAPRCVYWARGLDYGLTIFPPAKQQSHEQMAAWLGGLVSTTAVRSDMSLGAYRFMHGRHPNTQETYHVLSELEGSAKLIGWYQTASQWWSQGNGPMVVSPSRYYLRTWQAGYFQLLHCLMAFGLVEGFGPYPGGRIVDAYDEPPKSSVKKWLAEIQTEPKDDAYDAWTMPGWTKEVLSTGIAAAASLSKGGAGFAGLLSGKVANLMSQYDAMKNPSAWPWKPEWDPIPFPLGAIGSNNPPVPPEVLIWPRSLYRRWHQLTVDKYGGAGLC